MLADLIATIDAATLSAPAKLTGIRLALRAVNLASASLYLSAEEIAAVVGSSEDGTIRAHLGQLKRAGVIDYHRNGACQVTILALARAQNDHRRVLSDHPRALSDHDAQIARALSDHPRALSDHDDAPRALSEPRRALAARPRAQSDLLTNSQSVSQLVTDLPTDILTDTRPPELPPANPVEVAAALGLLAEAGVARREALTLAQQNDLLTVRRAVGHWWDNRKSAGGQFDDRPGIVLTWLRAPDRFSLPACSGSFQASDLYRHHLLPAERAAEEAAALEEPEPEPEPEPELIRVADEHSQPEPAEDAPTGFDPARAWQQFAAAEASPDWRGTRLLTYDAATGAAVVLAPADSVWWLKSRGVIVARKRTPGLFGRPVFVEFVTEEEVHAYLQPPAPQLAPLPTPAGAPGADGGDVGPRDGSKLAGRS